MGTYADHGIDLPNNAHGETRVICPECTPGRKQQHQKEKDLCVNTQTGTWYCQHCGWKGGLNIKSNKPTDFIYHKPQYENPNRLPDNVLKFFESRKISKSTLDKCNIGYKPPHNKAGGAIMFPRYKNGEVVAVKYRTFDKRMWQSKNPEPCFYNYDMAKNSDKNDLIIVEGEIDCLSFIEAGFDNVVSVPDGAPPPSTQNIQLKYLDADFLDKFKNIIIATDGDEPGNFLAEEMAERIGKHKCLRAIYPAECKDANEVLVAYDKNELTGLCFTANPFPIDGLYTAKDVEKKIIELYKNGLNPGNKTGWPSLDRHYTVRVCEMTVLTGRPGSGKSTWLDALMVNLNEKYNWKIAFCSPENWPIERHIANIIEKKKHKPFGNSTVSCPRLSMEDINNTINEISNQFFFTQLQDRDMYVDGILDIMHGAISRHGVKGVVLDPWNEIEHHRPTHLSETEFVSEALGKIRRFARMNNVHVWIVAHPKKQKQNEDGTYPVPRMYDISGSAHWFNKADNGISIHRPDPLKPYVDIHVQKIRFKEIGRIGNTTLCYIDDDGTYREINPSKEYLAGVKKESNDFF